MVGEERRSQPRKRVALVARQVLEGVAHSSVVRNLSVSGAYLERSAASMFYRASGSVQLELPLPGQAPIHAEASVVYDTFGPSETQPESLVLGTALRFEQISRADRDRLADWVRQQEISEAA